MKKLTLLLAVCLAVLAGCSDDDDDGGNPPPRPSLVLSQYEINAGYQGDFTIVKIDADQKWKEKNVPHWAEFITDIPKWCSGNGGSGDDCYGITGDNPVVKNPELYFAVKTEPNRTAFARWQTIHIDSDSCNARLNVIQYGNLLWGDYAYLISSGIYAVKYVDGQRDPDASGYLNQYYVNEENTFRRLVCGVSEGRLMMALGHILMSDTELCYLSILVPPGSETAVGADKDAILHPRNIALLSKTSAPFNGGQNVSEGNLQIRRDGTVVTYTFDSFETPVEIIDDKEIHYVLTGSINFEYCE